MMNNKDQDLCLALAGIVQACTLINQIATRGIIDLNTFEDSLNSLFSFDADDVPSVFGSILGVGFGLRQVQKILNDRSVEHKNILRYMIATMQVAQKHIKNQHLLDQVHNELQQCADNADQNGIISPLVCNNLAQIYSDTFGLLEPKIMVTGNQQHLKNTENINRIRALLFAAIRASILWTQLGGKRWMILFHRKRLVENARILLRGTLH